MNYGDDGDYTLPESEDQESISTWRWQGKRLIQATGKWCCSVQHLSVVAARWFDSQVTDVSESSACCSLSVILTRS
jgi:hypothetical protein